MHKLKKDDKDGGTPEKPLEPEFDRRLGLKLVVSYLMGAGIPLGCSVEPPSPRPPPPRPPKPYETGPLVPEHIRLEKELTSHEQDLRGLVDNLRASKRIASLKRGENALSKYRSKTRGEFKALGEKLSGLDSKEGDLNDRQVREVCERESAFREKMGGIEEKILELDEAIEERNTYWADNVAGLRSRTVIVRRGVAPVFGYGYSIRGVGGLRYVVPEPMMAYRPVYRKKHIQPTVVYKGRLYTKTQLKHLISRETGKFNRDIRALKRNASQLIEED